MRYSILTKLVNLFYPPRCMFCRRNFDDHAGLMICPKCLSFYEYETPSTVLLPDGHGNVHYALNYRDDVRAAILRYKFSGMAQYAHGLAHFMLPFTGKFSEIDYISWVPISPLRYISRTYDQSKLLAQALAKETGLEAIPTLRKIRHTRKQSTLGVDARRKNVINAYHTVHPDRIRGARILLVDDIVTTGATMAECSKVLYEAGAEYVFFIALAHGSGK